ncbi:hypothetical protein ABZY93_15195 [Streptomyces smyrnaeus]|uniref:hypothetical protein n=1 Tax=Streptomyces smyrnaeus TaxID=1387713 RepID=UPI0033A94B34
MTNGDLRHGRCGACGGGEVYRGEYAAQGGLRPPGGGVLGAKATVFDAFVCAGCGNTQLCVRLDPKMVSYIRKRLTWVPPQQGPD